MDSEIATASVNTAKVKTRGTLDLAFRAIKKIVGSPLGENPTIALHPPVDTTERIGDLVNRMGWYFPPRSVDDVTIRIPVADDSVRPDDTDTVEPPDNQPKYSVTHLNIEMRSGERSSIHLDDADGILLWKASKSLSANVIRNIGKTYIVDPNYYSHREANTWASISEGVRNRSRDRSREVFKRLEDEALDYGSAYVFATGPSLSEATEFEFPDDSLKIICNSIVKNDELLSHIDPDVLTFADPVFHFGPSRYADAFRRDAVEALDRYGCTAIVPDRFYGLLCGHFEGVEEYAVGMEATAVEKPLYPTHDALEVKETGNIMTRFMLPVASRFADDVYIVGADGREEDESYFWKHSEEAQYEDELMETAFTCHPAFFRDRVYADYYDQHVETLTGMIADGEERGINYHSLTESFIPCLQERKVSGDDHPKVES